MLVLGGKISLFKEDIYVTIHDTANKNNQNLTSNFFEGSPTEP